MKRLLLLIGLLLALSGCAWAEITIPPDPQFVYVNAETVSGTRDGTSWDNAFATVQEGLTRASEIVTSTNAPVEVWVAKGPYSWWDENNCQVGAKVSLYGGFAGNESVKTARNWRVNETQLISFETSVATVKALAGSVAIDGFTIQSAEQAIACDTNASPFISHNKIEFVGIGIRVSSGSPTITENLILDTSPDSQIPSAEGCGAIDCYAGSPHIINNTIIRQVFGAGYGIRFDAQSEAYVYNNIIVGFHTGIDNAAVTGVQSYLNNNTFGSNRNFSGTVPPSASGNISANPLFVSDASAPYRLSIESPCIDTGYDGVVIDDVDYDCKMRLTPIYGRGIALRYVDMGAYEFPDDTAPTTPVVTDDGVNTLDHTKLHAAWNSSDPESGIAVYKYAVGTSSTDPGSGYLVPWTLVGDDTEVTVNLSLQEGTTYYFYVKAYNCLQMASEVGVSDGITCAANPPEEVATPYFIISQDDYYLSCHDVKIECATPSVTIKYILDTPEHLPAWFDGHGNLRDYNPASVIPVAPGVGNCLVLMAKAYKGALESPVAAKTFCVPPSSSYPYPTPGPACYYVVDADPESVKGLRVTDISMAQSPGQKTVRIEWNPVTGADTYIVKRIAGGQTVELGTVQNTFFEDSYDCSANPTYKYAVAVSEHTQTPPPGLPACVGCSSDPSCHPKVIYHWLTGPDVEVSVTPVEEPVVANQTVDSRPDTRTCEVPYANHKFKGSIYRGGLFAGFAAEPDKSRVGRSYARFSLPAPSAGQMPWTASVNAYHTYSLNDTPTDVTCQYVANDTWDPLTLDWDTADKNLPMTSPVTAPEDTVVQVTRTVDAQGKQVGNWRHWKLAEIPAELYGDHLLSVGWASKSESSNSWAYFAKSEYDASLAPRVLCAFGAPPMVIALKLSASEIHGGQPLTGTVWTNVFGPVTVSLSTLSQCRVHVPETVDIPAGTNQASFIISTPPLSDENEMDTVRINAYLTDPELTKSGSFTLKH